MVELARLDMKLGCVVWVDRVASASNPADGPSRLEFETLAKLAGGRFQHVDALMLEKELLMFVLGRGVWVKEMDNCTR